MNEWVGEVQELFSQERAKPNIKEGWQNPQITHAAAIIIVHALRRRKVNREEESIISQAGWSPAV